MKKRLMAILLCILTLTALCGCKSEDDLRTYGNYKPLPAADETGPLLLFEYTFGCGFSETPIYCYRVVPLVGDDTYSYVFTKTDCITNEIVVTKNEKQDFADDLVALLYSSGATEWYGYCVNTGVTDGYEWDITATFPDDQFFASGNGSTPDNYQEIHDQIIAYFENHE